MAGTPFQLAIYTVNSALLGPLARRLPSVCHVRACVEGVVPVVDVVTWLPFRAAHAGCVRPIVQIASKVDKCDVVDKHIARASRCAIVATILRDGAAVLRAEDAEVAEQHVRHASPAAAARLVVRLVVSVATRDKFADPCLDVDCIADVVLSAAFDHRGLIDPDIRYACVIQVLAQGPNRNAIAAVASHVTDGDVEAARLDSNAVVTALVYEVCKRDVARVHRVEAISILHPVIAMRRLRRGCVGVYVRECHIGPVHDVDAP